MHIRSTRSILRAAVFAAAALALSGCNMIEKLSEVGGEPKTSRIEDPTQAPGYKPVSMPMPAAVSPNAGVNSLWRPGARDFLKDQRASEVGDRHDVLRAARELDELRQAPCNVRSDPG